MAPLVVDPPTYLNPHHLTGRCPNFRFRPPTASRNYALVDVVDSPEQADPRGRTQRYQAIRRRFGGQDAPEPGAAQQSALFDILDLGTELEEPQASGLGAARGEHEESEP